MRNKLSPAYTLRGFRRRLADIEALPQFAILGIVSGVVTGSIMLVFRFSIEWPLISTLPTADYEGFESLSPGLRFMLPVLGSLCLAAIFVLVPATMHRVGVTHVLERLSRNRGNLPLGNTLLQFVTGSIALLSGHSAGREGPAIHLGAAASSLLGQYLKLPHNSIRILVGCGVAGAISASFNTPLAGVIFSMEVILMEYTIAGFIPVILAAVSANLISRIAYGDQTAFQIPQINMESLYDLPGVVIEGLVIGCVAAAFIRLVALAGSLAPRPIWVRMLIAGGVTGLLAIWVPEIMGVGYDTVNATLTGEPAALMLLIILVAKLLATSTSVGMGIPAGLIGPSMYLGATAGGLFAICSTWIYPEQASDPAFYVLLGMGAMMGAVLQAPLSALLAVMELSQNPGIILPSMLIIVVASMTTSQLFGHNSIFISLLESQGASFRYNPVMIALDRLSVASLMQRKFVESGHLVQPDQLKVLLDQEPDWIIVSVTTNPSFVINAVNLRDYLDTDSVDMDPVNLSEIPVQRRKATPIPLQATLAEALAALSEERSDALYVIRSDREKTCLGVLTRQEIEDNYNL